PVGQDGKGLLAWRADSAPNPGRFTLIVVALAEPPSVTNDGVLPADRTLPRQEGQRDYPGSMLSFGSGSAIKRITAGVKAAADRRCQVSIWGPAFTLPVKSVSNEKRILLSVARREPHSEHWPVINAYVRADRCGGAVPAELTDLVGGSGRVAAVEERAGSGVLLSIGLCCGERCLGTQLGR